MNVYKSMELRDIDSFKNATLDIIKNYCIENDIDEKNIHPLEWDDILQEIALQLFIPNGDFLKTDSKKYNQYNVDTVWNVFIYIYRSICNKHKMTLDITDFCIMTNISRQTIYNIKVSELTCNTFDTDKMTLAELIVDFSEKSYENALKGSTQHMKFLPTLNKRFGYALPGTNSNQRNAAALIDRGSVVQLDGTNSALLPDLSTNDNK